MDFSLTEEEIEVVNLIKQVADEQLAPKMIDIDESGAFSWENFKLLGELGVLGALFPEEYGGTDLGYLVYAMCVEEISRGRFQYRACAVCAFHDSQRDIEIWDR